MTGAGGQLGRALVRSLGDQAVGVDLPEFDLTDRDSVHGVVQRHRPNVVVNAAAFTQVDLAENEPELCRAVNVHGVEILLEACRDVGARILQISTDYVFDGRQGSPYSESDRPNPLNTYGRTKWEAEQIVAQAPDHLILRAAGLFGPGGPTATRNFVDIMLKLAEQETSLRVVEDQVTSFTYTLDLAAAIKALLESEEKGLFHVTNLEFASWFQFAMEIFRIANLSPTIEPVRMAEYRCDAERPRFSVLDTGKYAALAACYPMRTWQEALEDFLSGRLC